MLLGVAGLLAGAGPAGGARSLERPTPFAAYKSAVASDEPVADYRMSDARGSTVLADAAGGDNASNAGISLGHGGPFPGSASGEFSEGAHAALAADPLPGATQFTAEAWIDWSGGAYGQPVFRFESNPRDRWYLTPASSRAGRGMRHGLRFELRTPGGSAQISGPSLKPRTWEDVAITETTAGVLTLYLNGVETARVAGQTISPATVGRTDENYLGGSFGAGQPSFQGKLSNVAFYPTALPAGEIAAHYDDVALAVRLGQPTIVGHAAARRSATESADRHANPRVTPRRATATAASLSECTDTWIGGSEGTWQIASNWSTGSTPGSSDVACIESGATVSVTAEANEAGTLESDGTVVLAGGSLALTDAGASSNTHALLLDSGVLTGAATLEVTSSLTWSGGTMSGSGKTVVAAGASGAIESSGAVALSERTLANAGTLTLSEGSMSVSANAEIDNSGTFYVDADAPASEWFSHGVLKSDGSHSWIHNTGTVKKTAGSQYSQIQIEFDNAGTVESNTGQLIFSGGSHSGDEASGSWVAGEGSSLAFSGGTFSLGAGTHMSGLAYLAGGSVTAPDLQASAATLLLWSGGSTLELSNASTASHVGSLAIHEGTTLTGAATLEVTSSLTWSGGTMSGSGKTVVAAGASGAIESSGAVALSERTLANAGTLTLSEGSMSVSANAEIDNSGTFYVDADAPASEWFSHGVLKSDGSHSWIHNTGTVKKTAGSQYSQIQIEFDNAGTVESNTGQLIFSGGSHSGDEASGSWVAGEGSSLAFSGGTFSLGAGTHMSGLAYLAGGSVTAPDLQASAATLLLWSGGSTLELSNASTASHVGSLAIHEGTTLTGAATLEVTSSLTWSGGTMSGSGKTVVAAGEVSATSYLWQRTVVSNGSLAMPYGSTLVGGEGAVLENAGTFSMNGSLTVGRSGTLPAVVNDGTLQRIEDPNPALIEWSIDNEGTVHSSIGTLEFAGGGTSGRTSPGTWSAGPAGEVMFRSGTFLLGEAVPMAGRIRVGNAGSGRPSAEVVAGTVEGTTAELLVSDVEPGCGCSPGLMRIEGSAPSTVDALVIDGGTLAGVGGINVTGSFTASAFGTMEGTGTTTIDSGASATVSTGEDLYVYERKIVNDGLLTVPYESRIVGGEGAVLENAGTFSMNGTVTVERAGTLPAIVNDGTLQRVEDPNPARIAWSIDNEGTVDSSIGTLEFAGGGTSGVTSPGTWSAGPAGEIMFREGTYDLGSEVPLEGLITATEGSTVYNEHPAHVSMVGIKGTPSLRVFGGSVSVVGSVDLKGIDINSGTLTIDGDAAVSNELQWSGGEMAGAGTTVLEETGEGVIDPGPNAPLITLDGRTLANDGAIDWTAGEMLGTGGAILRNAGYLNLVSSTLGDAAGLTSEEPLAATFENEGVIENDGSGVDIDWETYNSGTLPGADPPECVVCIITDPDAEPPSGTCGVAQSAGLRFTPLPDTPFPPSYETFTQDWSCTDPEH